MNELWRVQAANGEVRMMSLDDLDRAFNAGWIHSRTNVLAPGSMTWMTLGDAAGLEEPAPYVEQTPSLSPMAIAGPSSYSLPQIPQQTAMSSLGLDDEDFAPKRSKKGIVFGFMVAAAAAACAFGLTTGKLQTIMASGHAEAALAAEPKEETKLPEPAAKAAPATVAAEAPKPVAPSAASVTDDLKKKLLDADKAREDAKKKKGGKRRRVQQDGDAPAPAAPTGGELKGSSDKFDPLNGAI